MRHKLRDNIYVDFDGHYVSLSTQNSDGYPTQQITLSLTDYNDLVKFIQVAKAARELELNRLKDKK